MPPLPTSIRSIVISSHLRLGLPTSLLPSGLPTKILYAPLLSPIRATRPFHLHFLDLITQIIFGERCRSWSSLLHSLLHFAVTSSLLGPNILLSTLFLNPLSLYSSLDVRYYVSHPYKATGKILFLDILIFTFLDIRLDDLTFRHRASCILGQAFHYSPENAFYIFNQQIYFIIWYLLDRASLI